MGSIFLTLEVRDDGHVFLLSKPKKFIQDFLDKTSSLGTSEKGQAIIDVVRILDALGVDKETIESIVVDHIRNLRP